MCLYVHNCLVVGCKTANVDFLVEQFVGPQALVAGLCECVFRIFAKCQRSVRLAKPVTHAPILRTVGLD